MKAKLKFLIPLAIFLGLAVFLFKGLYLDPRTLPSVLINKPVPQMAMPSLWNPDEKFTNEQMLGKVWMLNVWATWCVPCKEEHPYLVKLKREGLKTPLIGFLYKDQPGAGIKMLKKSGNPYDLVVYEINNKVGIDLGVTGVPETFVIDKKGTIRAKVSYPINDEIWFGQLKPLIDQLEAE